MRAAAATDAFRDPEAFAAFPPTRAVDGSELTCSALFDLQFDDGVHIDPTIDAGVLHPIGVVGSRAWLYDAAQGGFVEQVDAHDPELGFGLASAGLWCLGEATTPNDCIVVDVVDDTGAAVADARVDIVSLEDFGTILRRTSTNVDGTSACVDVARSSTVVAVEGPNGARASVVGVEFASEGPTSCALDGCTHVDVTLPSTPYESCLVVRPAIDIGKGFSILPTGTLLLREDGNNGQQHRGSFPWNNNLVERCVAVPNRGYRLTANFIEDEGGFCAFSVDPAEIDASEQSSSTEPPVCGSEDCTSIDLDFFCGGS